MLENAAWILGLIIKIFSLWFFITSVAFWKKPKSSPQREAKIRFACVIPARNEEKVIAEAVKSLKAQDYPAELFDIYVVPNSCTDSTQRRAMEAGAKILRCGQAVSCKGDVLHLALGHLMGKNYDAFCVFDADNLVGGSFLARMNDAFLDGAGVCKGRILTKNPGDSWVTGCYAVYNGMTEIFYNGSRANLGLSAKLVGTGFAVSRETLLRTSGWKTVSMAEDAEFSAICAEMGEKIRYVPEAVTYDEAPASFSVSLVQRKRWCSGIMSVSRLRLGKLFSALPRADFPRLADSIAFFCAPFVQAFSPLPFLLSAALSVGNGGKGSLSLIAVGLLGSYVGVAALAMYIYLRLRRPKGALKAVFLFPVFMFSWIPLQISALLRPVSDWREIKHVGKAACKGAAWQL